MQDSTTLLSQLARNADRRPPESTTPRQHEARRLFLLALDGPGYPGSVSQRHLEPELLTGGAPPDLFIFGEEEAVQ
jgi:hypothetical protein